jgi:hypothetical protein
LKKIIASGRASLIQTIFRRIICAKRPLTIDELLEAITINSQDRTFPLARIPTHGLRVVQACLNLVVLDDDDTVRLAHQTIQQFLCTLPEPSAFRCDFAQANKELGELCVAYLAFSDFETQLVRQDQTMEILASAIYSCHPLQAQTAAATRLYKRVRRGQNKQKPYYDFNHMRRLSSSPSIEIRRKYRLLDYIREYWFFHTLDLAPDNTALWVTFKNLLLYKTFPFAFKPWGKTVSTGKVPFLWAIHTGHATAFQHLFGPDHMRRCYLEHSDEHQECYETRLRLFSMPYFTRPDVVLFFLTILVTYRERADYLKNHFQHDSNANVGEVLSTLATRNDSSDLVKTIFNDWDDSDLSPLHRAARMGHMAILQKLLELGGNTQVTGRLGQTPLHDANDQEVAWILLFYGAESNASTPHGESPLHDAVFHSRHTVVRELLWQGANPNGTTIDGETPLHYALSGGDSGVISPRLGERSHGSFYSRIEVIKELLVHGADPNSIDSFGQSPLHWASRAGSVKIANMLREYGANDEVTATSGETPLYAARL